MYRHSDTAMFYASIGKGVKPAGISTVGVFNSLDDTAVRVYVGTWGARKGRVWWDDIEFEEVGLLNVLRRPGCP